jgi:hypothetical protein
MIVSQAPWYYSESSGDLGRHVFRVLWTWSHERSLGVNGHHLPSILVPMKCSYLGIISHSNLTIKWKLILTQTLLILLSTECVYIYIYVKFARRYQYDNDNSSHSQLTPEVLGTIFQAFLKFGYAIAYAIFLYKNWKFLLNMWFCIRFRTH